MAEENQSDLIALYISFKDDARGWLTLHRQHVTQFIALILAVLGATIAAYVRFLTGEPPVVPRVLVLGPLVGVFLSILAVFVCNKFYKRYAEHDAVSISILRMLSPDLGVYEIIPKRWRQRFRDDMTPDEYAKWKIRNPRSGSSNLLIVCTFIVLVIVSAFLFGAIWLDSA